MPDQDQIDTLVKQGKFNDLAPFETTGKWYAGAAPLAKAIGAELAKAKIVAPLESNVPSIIVTRQQAADVEYIFAINATYDEGAGGDKNAVKAVTANLALPDNGRPVYDAVVGGAVHEFAMKDGKLAGAFRFGPGEMRVFARTAHPIGGVRIADPVVVRELVLEESPLRLDLAANVVDTEGRPVSGSIPLRVRLIDPLGVARYDLYRATKLGQLNLGVPLAANDPPGSWKLEISELLADTAARATFAFAPPPRVRALAGATPRAVMARGDLDHVFRFVRTHHDVTIVAGKSPFNDAAAERLTKTLAPWGVRCKRMDLDAAAKSAHDRGRRSSHLVRFAIHWPRIDQAGPGQPADAGWLCR